MACVICITFDIKYTHTHTHKYSMQAWRPLMAITAKQSDKDLMSWFRYFLYVYFLGVCVPLEFVIVMVVVALAVVVLVMLLVFMYYI